MVHVQVLQKTKTKRNKTKDVHGATYSICKKRSRTLKWPVSKHVSNLEINQKAKREKNKLVVSRDMLNEAVISLG